MLHRNFKPAKCKTSLKLAVSRIKLLKNKRAAQVTQLKRELAQLLESGQDQTARIRVEHVVREEKTMAAYDLIEIYCELIAARLPIIESQKKCPIDLKEAITSVVFASPRCADVPELLDIRKHFTVKYGKEFISSAVELRPECGVSRILVEKLSALAPDGQTKIKILSAIAEEHNIKWDPMSFGDTDSKPPNDLLNGPSTLGKTSMFQAEPPYVQGPPNPDQKHDVTADVYVPNTRSSVNSQNVLSTDIDPNNFHPEVNRAGIGPMEREFRHLSSGEKNVFAMDRQNWNMEFKDATSAAQVAAESAERASMAARAAAELSARGRISRQYSRESQKSSAYGLRDEEPGKYAGLNYPDEHFAKDLPNIESVERADMAAGAAAEARGRIARQYSKESQKSSTYGLRDEGPGKYIDSNFSDEHLSNDLPNNFSHDRNSRMQNEKVDGNGQDNFAGVAQRLPGDAGNTRRSSGFASFKSSAASMDEDIFVHGVQKADRYYQRTSSEVDSINPQQSESQNGMKTENIDYIGEARYSRQSSTIFSHSHANPSGDDYGVNLSTNFHVYGNDAVGDFSADHDEGEFHTHTKQLNSYDKNTVVFDDSASDDGEGSFNVEDHSGRESNLYFPSPGRKSPTHFSANTNGLNPRQNESETLGNSTSQSHFFTESYYPSELSGSLKKSVENSRSEDLPPVTFDDSDDPCSESEEELEKSKVPLKQSVFDRNPKMTWSESHMPTGSSFEAEKNFSSADLPAIQPSIRRIRPQLDPNDMDRESFYEPEDDGKHLQSLQSLRLSLKHGVEDNDALHSPESPDTVQDTAFSGRTGFEGGKELNFGMLTGGLRNKGYRNPPYTNNRSDNASSSFKQMYKDIQPATEQSTTSPAAETPANFEACNQEPHNQKIRMKINKNSTLRAPVTHFDSTSDDFEELSLQNLSGNQEAYNQKVGKTANKNSSSRAPIPYFESDSGDSEEELHKQTSASRVRSSGGFSRRTKASPSYSKTSSDSKVTVAPNASVASNYGSERRKPFSRSSRTTESPLKPGSQDKGMGPWEGYEESRSAQQASFKPLPEAKTSLPAEVSKPPEKMQPSHPLPRIVTSSTEESLKTSGGETPSTAYSRKASHVHPNLPDYDTLFQTLRMNRQ
ncbi:uncharacterized protein LOC131158043 [Malania oleifera]|uniref:uncharacterized protein LOC131158043 n=1 Tax=Malania oleifera TaxID=397392 RepID=UPI0025ADAD20|nr:uncharacterized protein LOC131158043 [Malania oleifera]